MLKRQLALVSAALCILPACTTTSGALESVMKRAPFDLNCEAAQVQATELSSGQGGYTRTVGASGCGRKATYLVQGDGLNGYVAALNSPTGETEKK